MEIDVHYCNGLVVSDGGAPGQVIDVHPDDVVDLGGFR